MVNTRTDAELAAAVQAAVDAMLPQIREQVREEYRTGAVTSGSNPPPVTIHTWLERFNKQKPRSFEKAVAPVDAENWISHMEKIFDRFLRLAGFLGQAAGTAEEQAKNFRWGLHKHKSGDRYQSATQQNSYRGHDQKNDRQGSDRQGGGGFGAGKKTRDKGQVSHNPVPLEGYTHPVCTTCGRRHPGECRRAAGTCFKCGQAGHLQRDCKKNTGASSSGHADKKPERNQAVSLHHTQESGRQYSSTITEHY
ncbi:zinc finger, CCHC-type, retrotransposon gag domain protein [Tanacetum coccineum]|uniref:Zinc finger, CCHC-type, retrotransposon gag domain protein n=1 Tax=Tanacetum coccineum TaxID=301880 RepID=A0ABQ4Y3E3_9ASTR